MSIDHRALDALRENRSELENHYIDELEAGRISRRQFVQKGAVVGLSTGLMGAILSACGSANSTGKAASSSGTSASSGPVTKGGTIRLAQQVPAGQINPITIDDVGGLNLLAQTGEFLALDNEGTLEPGLATSWKASDGGKTWTFKLRSGVKFHDGSPMTADDVVWTCQQQAGSKTGGNALSTFDGVLSSAGVRKVDDTTVEFHLDAANGNFPYIVSSDNYNLIIVPKGTDWGKWQKTFMGTGPFKLKSYSQGQGATFVANPDYWGGKPNIDGSAFTFESSQAPQLVALEGGSVDVVCQFVAQGAGAVIHSSKYDIIRIKASLHRELSMRCDQKPFDDPRVRQAVALTLNRPDMVTALLAGLGQVGNDSPFAPVFKSTNTSVPQRVQDLAKAKSLLSAAGHSSLSATMYTEQYEEIPGLAQTIAAQAAKAGINIKLKVETQAAYYGKATYGNSDWLDGEMSLVDYGDRGVPNVFLQATLTKGGTEYDNLVAQYIATVDLSIQRSIAGKIEKLLLNETPLIIPYFYDNLTAVTPSVKGAQPTAISQILLKNASLTA
jgi:peptide/nickel transport system substrate-binding protein